MDLCLIDYIIRSHQINLSYIMTGNLIIAHDQKQKPLPHDHDTIFFFDGDK